jgi:1-acyl-sn-glycerol-3-phosphate acyltransferase
MLQVLRGAWAVYGILAFGIQLLLWIPVIVVSFLVLGRRAEWAIIWIGHHVIAPVTLFLVGVRRSQQGRAVLDGKGPFVIVSNHLSFLDILINAAAFPGIYKFLSKKEMTKIPIWGFVVGRLCILVDRKSPESRAASMERMREALQSGYSILIYPEGSRNRTHAPLSDYYDGAFRLAAETGFPLAVMTLHDPRRCNDLRKGLHLQPGRVDVYWDLIPETAGRPPGMLKDQTRAFMASHLPDYLP